MGMGMGMGTEAREARQLGRNTSYVYVISMIISAYLSNYFDFLCLFRTAWLDDVVWYRGDDSARVALA